MCLEVVHLRADLIISACMFLIGLVFKHHISSNIKSTDTLKMKQTTPDYRLSGYTYIAATERRQQLRGADMIT